MYLPCGNATKGKYFLYEIKLAVDTLRRRDSLSSLSAFLRLGNGQGAFCNIHKNGDGKLYSSVYGISTGFAIDPIEKETA